MSGTDDAEREARTSLDDAISHFAAFRSIDNRDVVDDCVARYASAVRASERARLAAELKAIPSRYGSLIDRGAVLAAVSGEASA